MDRPSPIRNLRFRIQFQNLCFYTLRHPVIPPGIGITSVTVGSARWAGRFGMTALTWLVLLRRIFENIGGYAVAHVDTRTFAICLTVAYNQLAFGNG